MIQENSIELEKWWLQAEEANQGGAVFFQTLMSFLFCRSTNRIKILFNEDLFVKIEEFRILLDQGDQIQIELIKILQASNGQDHLIVQIGVVL